MEYIDGEYVITNPISEQNLRDMRNNMDAADVEQFDKFVEKHWGNQLAKKETVTVSAETEEKPKKRGRKKKSTHCSRRNSSHLSVTKATQSIPLWNTQLSICISSRTKMVHHTNCLVFARTSECIINHLQ